MRKLMIPALAVAMSLSAGCFFVSKKPANHSSQASTSEPKNHGQERSAEAHEANAERKAEHDAEKADKKNDKK